MPSVRVPDENCKFYKKSSPRGIVDFSVMSGTFNLSVTDDIKIWEKYILKNLTNIWKKTNKIMAFNLLHQNKRKINNQLLNSLNLLENVEIEQK